MTYEEILDLIDEQPYHPEEPSLKKEYVAFKEVVELFCYSVIPDIMNEYEVPKVNFLFPEEAFQLFQYVKEHPFTKDGYLIPDIKEEDILRLYPQNQQDPNCPTIIVKNPKKFFELLTDITNAWLEQKAKYMGYGSGRSMVIRGIRRIWLRMSPQDFTNVEDFLEKQLTFLKSTTFDEYIKREETIGHYADFTIKAKKEENETWCETNDKMTFQLHDDTRMYHELPSIYFATEEAENQTIAYIYAIQNKQSKKENKKIARYLYKLNKGIENPNVHPSAVLALKTFIDLLASRGITEIKIPCLQVLSYRYHELLSEKTKQNFLRKWTPERLEELKYASESRRKRMIEEYEHDKTWYSHVVGKEDFISQTKTEGLYNIFLRVQEQFGNITILNEPFQEDEYLHIRINTPEKQIKK